MSKPADNILLAIAGLGLLTGTLDAIAAIIISYPATPEQIARFIASGLFGNDAFSGENMVAWGIFIHYMIALAFSAAFFTLHLKFRKLTKNIYILAVIYGVLIWVTMNLAVLPLTEIPKRPEHDHIIWWPIIKGMLALIICLGLPIAIFAERYYRRIAKRRTRRDITGKMHG